MCGPRTTIEYEMLNQHDPTTAVRGPTEVEPKQWGRSGSPLFVQQTLRS
jgi:hypothetical protein